jgi:hypothetical protein
MFSVLHAMVPGRSLYNEYRDEQKNDPFIHLNSFLEEKTTRNDNLFMENLI